MHLRPITIEVRSPVISDFKRLAKEVFPKEAFAYLLGRDAGNLVEIEDLWVPPDLASHTCETFVEISPTWIKPAKRAAKDLGLSVVGDIHSHPFTYSQLGNNSLKWLASPSVGDMESGLEWITAICAVVQNKDGRFRSTVKFWGPMFPVRTWVKTS